MNRSTKVDIERALEVIEKQDSAHPVPNVGVLPPVMSNVQETVTLSRFASIFEKIRFFRDPSSSSAEKERHRQAIKKLRVAGVFKGIPAPKIEAIAEGHPVFAEMLAKYDTNNDGEIDQHELSDLLHDLSARRQQNEWLKKLLVFAGVFLLILLVSNSLLTVWMIKLTKEVYVDNGSNGMISSKGDMLKTEKPKFYTSISSITSLPPTALEAITHMTFTTVNGGLYSLMVTGKEKKMLSIFCFQVVFYYLFPSFPFLSFNRGRF
jgi:hypothetical protein